MRYTIEFKPSAVRQFVKLSRSVQQRLKSKIDALAENPRPPGAKKLSDSDKLYRIRSGDYRIIYQIRDEVLLVLVVKVGDRKDIYRKK